MTGLALLAVAAISFPETSCDMWLRGRYGKLPFVLDWNVSREEEVPTW